MKKYEMMFIVKSTVEENVASATVENIKNIVTSMKGEITKFDDLGNKKLAYPIKKEVTGSYYVMYFNANNEIISELDRKSRIDETILRHLIIKLDEE